MPPEENQSSALARIERITAGSNAAEAVLNVFKAVLATTPFAGGIASLMTDYIPSSRQRRVEDFAERIAEDLKRLQSRIDEEYFRTDDFAFMFEKCFRGAAENPQHEKLRAFRGILINSAVDREKPPQEKEYYLNLVNTLSELHIRILRFLAEPREYLADMGRTVEHLQGGFGQMFHIAIPDVDLEVVKSAFGDLHQAGLINTSKSIFATMTSAQCFHLLGDRVSDMGRRFVNFCAVPS